MGIDTKDKTKNGDEDKTGSYTGAKGAYTIAGNQASNGDEADGRTAMETLLSKNLNINVVYSSTSRRLRRLSSLESGGKREGRDHRVHRRWLHRCRGGQVGNIRRNQPAVPEQDGPLGMEAIVKLTKSEQNQASPLASTSSIQARSLSRTSQSTACPASRRRMQPRFAGASRNSTDGHTLGWRPLFWAPGSPETERTQQCCSGEAPSVSDTSTPPVQAKPREGQSISLRSS
jgi:hypothetical protein